MNANITDWGCWRGAATTLRGLLDVSQAWSMGVNGSDQVVSAAQGVRYGLPLRAQVLAKYQLLLCRFRKIGETEDAAADQKVDHVFEYPH